MINVGDRIEQGQHVYRIEHLGKVSRQIAKTGVARSLVLSRGDDGKARFMAWLWDNGETSRVWEIA